MGPPVARPDLDNVADGDQDAEAAVVAEVVEYAWEGVLHTPEGVLHTLEEVPAGDADDVGAEVGELE